VKGPSHCAECGAVIDSDLYTADKMRQRFFATLHDVWSSLPDAMRDRFPSSEVLRKHALIAVGWCDVATVVAGSKSAAPGIAAFIKSKDHYCIVIERGDVLLVSTARSMSRRALPKKQFLEVAQKVFDWIYAVTGIDANARSEAA
jgi:hypothetical protein